MSSGETNSVKKHPATVVTDAFQQLFRLPNEPRMINGLCKLNVTKMTRTLRHVLIAGCAFELTIDGTKSWIVQTVLADFGFRFVHRIGVEYMAHTHSFDFIRRKQTKLHFLDRSQRRIRVRED